STMPIPPSPIRRSTRYLPTRTVPGGIAALAAWAAGMEDRHHRATCGTPQHGTANRSAVLTAASVRPRLAPMDKVILVLASVGLLSCSQVLGLDDFGDRLAASSSGSGGTSVTSTHSTGGSSSTGTGGAGGQAPSYTAGAVSGGEKHTCALLTDGRIVCW